MEKNIFDNIRRTLKDIYLTPFIILVLVLLALNIVGIIDSYYDMNFNRIFGLIPLVTPGILSAVYMLKVLWKKKDNIKEVIRYFNMASFVSGVPLIIMNMIIVIITWMIPRFNSMVEVAGGNNSWLRETLLMQVMTTGLLGLAAQILGAVLVILIIVLPVLSLKNPKMVAEGSNIAEVKGARGIMRTTRFLYVGFAMALLGVIMAMMTEGLTGLSHRVTFIISGIQYGYISLSWIIWIIGLLLLLVGAILVLIALFKVIFRKQLR
jgi:hypothetical protein